MYAVGQKFTGIITIVMSAVSVLFGVLTLIAIGVMGSRDGMYDLLWWMIVITIVVLMLCAVLITFASRFLKGGWQPGTAIVIVVAQTLLIGFSIASNILDNRISAGESSNNFIAWLGYIISGIIVLFAALHAAGKGFSSSAKSRT